MGGTRSALVSEELFLSLPETMDRVELLDGEVIVSPSPTLRHQEILRRILYALGTWATGLDRPVLIGQSPMDVRFAHSRILQPDAFVILAKVALDHEGPLDRIPELCIEVASADRVYDRLTKRMVYASSGVREYWVVEPSGIIERWSGDALEVAEEVSGLLTTPLLEGFELDVPTLFR